MKDKNLPNDYNSLSLEDLTDKAMRMIEDLESQKNLNSSTEKYQNLIKLNLSLIHISEPTRRS